MKVEYGGISVELPLSLAATLPAYIRAYTDITATSDIVDVEFGGMLYKLPRKLGEMTDQLLKEHDVNTVQLTGDTFATAIVAKWTYMEAVSNIYSMFMKAIQTAQTGNKKLDFTIEGKYHDKYKIPSFDYWAGCNPGKTTAVNYIVDELRANGWEPNFQLSAHTMDAEGKYSGGDTITITCDFTE